MPQVAIADGEIHYETTGDGHPLFLYPPDYVNAHDAKLVILRGGGHSFSKTRPADFNRTVLDFLGAGH